MSGLLFQSTAQSFNESIISLHDAALGSSDEFRESVHVRRLKAMSLDSFQCLRGVQLGPAKQAKGLFQLSKVVLAKPPAFQPDAVSSEDADRARGRCF